MKLSIRMAILARDHFRCRYCGRSAPEVVLEVDHVVPRSLGGTHEVMNLVTACRDCNVGKSDTPYAPPDVVYSEATATRSVRLARTIMRRDQWKPNSLGEIQVLKERTPGLADLLNGSPIRVRVGEQTRTWIMGVRD